MSILLTWTDPNPMESGYKVYKSTSPMDATALPSPIAVLSPSTTVYEDSEVDHGTIYYYRVSAFDSLREEVSGEVHLEAGPPLANIVFSFTGSSQSYTPAGEDYLDIYAWGAGGAGGSRAPISYNDALPGGAGGFTYARMPVAVGDAVTIGVGGGGTQNNTGSSNPAAYGGGGLGWGGGNQNGGGGGGRSFVTKNGIELVTAGGGGGGQSVGGSIGGGAGGGSSGVAGGNGSTTGGGAGSQISGGAATGSGSPGVGSAYTGGSGGGVDGSGGGGGGGYFGGGGGGGNSAGGGGGGGGSGHIAEGLAGYTTAGSGQTPPETLNTYYISGVGLGGNQKVAGGHGLVVLVPGFYVV